MIEVWDESVAVVVRLECQHGENQIITSRCTRTTEKCLGRMENFHKRYLRICREHHVFPLEAVVRHVQSVMEGNVQPAKILDLSSYNFTPEDCRALATTLAHDMYFEEVDFSDCLLSEESCKLLLLGLMENRSIKRLSLKGNNVRCGGAEVLGQFLKRNTCMESLQLEWNSLGLWDSGIACLAEGLALNQIVQVLDLRNNQITHEGASQIAAALRRNQILRTLDLRWNNLGLLGGREMLGMLKYNKNLTSLEMTGETWEIEHINQSVNAVMSVLGDVQASALHQSKEN